MYSPIVTSTTGKRCDSFVIPIHFGCSCTHNHDELKNFGHTTLSTDPSDASPKMKRPKAGCTSPHWYPSSVACSSLLNAISTSAGLRQVLQPYGILLVASTWLTPLDGLPSFFCNLLLRGYSKYVIPQGSCQGQNGAFHHSSITICIR